MRESTAALLARGAVATLLVFVALLALAGGAVASALDETPWPLLITGTSFACACVVAVVVGRGRWSARAGVVRIQAASLLVVAAAALTPAGLLAGVAVDELVRGRTAYAVASESTASGVALAVGVALALAVLLCGVPGRVGWWGVLTAGGVALVGGIGAVVVASLPDPCPAFRADAATWPARMGQTLEADGSSEAYRLAGGVERCRVLIGMSRSEALGLLGGDLPAPAGTERAEAGIATWSLSMGGDDLSSDPSLLSATGRDGRIAAVSVTP